VITINDVTYTEEQIKEKPQAEMFVARINQLREQLMQLEMSANELNVIINAYAGSISEIMEAEEKKES
jgi:Mg2+ and Co2+ transporter CorA